LSDSSDQSNDAAEQVQLCLKPNELATIILAVRAIGLPGFAERLEASSTLISSSWSLWSPARAVVQLVSQPARLVQGGRPKIVSTYNAD
jgi:hypothetical protein